MIGDVVTETAFVVFPPTVMVFENALCIPPEIVAFAEITSPGIKLIPVPAVHVPLEATVVVDPWATPFLKTWMTVPATSVDVPVTDVMDEVVQYVPVTVGANVTLETVTEADDKERQRPEAIAFAVNTFPKVNDKDEMVQLPPAVAVVEPISTPSAYKITPALAAEVPEMEVVVVNTGLVVIAGVAVVATPPIHIYTGDDSHCPLNVCVTR